MADLRKSSDIRFDQGLSTIIILCIIVLSGHRGIELPHLTSQIFRARAHHKLCHKTEVVKPYSTTLLNLATVTMHDDDAAGLSLDLSLHIDDAALSAANDPSQEVFRSLRHAQQFRASPSACHQKRSATCVSST